MNALTPSSAWITNRFDGLDETMLSLVGGRLYVLLLGEGWKTSILTANEQ